MISFLVNRCAGTTNRFRFRICEVRTCRATCICSFHLLVSDPCIRETPQNATLKGGVAARDCQQAVLWRRGFDHKFVFPSIQVEWTLKFPRRCAGSFVFHNTILVFRGSRSYSGLNLGGSGQNNNVPPVSVEFLGIPPLFFTTARLRAPLIFPTVSEFC